MNIEIKDLPENDDTFGSRLKAAREAARYTRPALAKETSIPIKSLEKYEYGTMSPDIVRLRRMASILEVSVSYLIDGKVENPATETQKTDTEENFLDLMQTLNAIDDARESGFTMLWRTVPKLLEELSEQLFNLNFDDLLDLAEKRELFVITENQLNAISETNPEEQDEQIKEIIERIIDTSIFGIDLYCIHEKDLSGLASNLEIEPDTGFIFGSWSGHSALVSSLRHQCRELALKGKSPKFLNEEEFRKREIA